MTLPEDTSRLREAWRELSGGARSFDDCPHPERIWDAARGELDSATTRELVEHIATCPACAEAWRLAQELEPAARAGDSAAADAQIPAKISGRIAGALNGRNGRRIAIAAMMILAVGLAWRFVRPSVEITERGSGIAVESLVPEGVALSRDDFSLSWTPGPAGSRYDLLLTTDRLSRVDEVRGLEEPRYQVPAAALAALASSSELLWRVEMTLPDGRHVASRAFKVRLK